MNWFSKILSKNTTEQLKKDNKYTNEYFEGYDFFMIGKKLSNDSILIPVLSNERRQQKKIAALEFFDQAIEKGYDESDVYEFRGMCLDNLFYHFDAIEDFNKAINKIPPKAILFNMRGMAKSFVYDYEGS